MTELDYVQWDITSVCNLNCKHCREKATTSNARDNLDLQQCKSLIDQIVAWKTRTLSVAGGEPLLSPLIWDVLAYGAGKFERLVISSNGTTITSETAKRLKSYVTCAQISIDGACAETHDNMRGKGNFAHAMRGIQLLQDAGVQPAVRMTVHGGNMHEVTAFVDLAHDLGLPDAYLRRVIPSGNAKQLSPLSAQDLKRTLGEAIKHGQEIGMHVASADYFCQITFNQKAREKAEKTQAANGKVIGGCAIGIKSFYVMQNGIIAYCPYLPIFCGDLRQDTLEKIWQTSQMLKVARSIRYNLKGKCNTCQYKFACGGCRAYAHATTGDILAEDSGCWI
ncbi:MAG: radical SAM protein [Patescibacteria group bacterium]|nr:radical SAM protein [Patescibacteria group bacterium]